MAQVSDFKAAASTHIVYDSEEQHPSLAVPLAFKIWCEKSRLTHSVFYIGREKSEHLNAIHVTYAKLVQTHVKLHAGSDVGSAVLAEATLRGSTIDLALTGGTQTAMKGKTSSCTSDWIFELPAEAHGDLSVFQWHRSKGDEVKQLGARGSGWELLWKREGHADEVVAVYTVDLCSIKLSGRFAFVGKGATEQFGPVFPCAAITGALALGQKKRDNLNLIAAIA